MIKININSKHVADIGDDKGLNQVTCDLLIGGTANDVRHELITLLETIEKRPLLYHIWIDVLSKWASKSCEEKGL